MHGIAFPNIQVTRGKQKAIRCIGSAVLMLVSSGSAFVCAADPQNWPGWRRDGSGISTDHSDIPVQWDSRTNIQWKTPLQGQGNSSPIVWNGKIYLTAWDDGGRRRSVLCLNSADGHIIWRTSVQASVFPTEQKNGYASGTCATDGKTVFAFFDSPGLIALAPTTERSSGSGHSDPSRRIGVWSRLRSSGAIL